MTTLAWLLPAIVAWAVLTRFFWKAGAWLPYYVAGSAGSALFIIVIARDVLPLEFWLRVATAQSVTALSNLIGLNTSLDRVAPGSLLVIGVPFNQEWTNLSIGLECSGLLESAVLIGLVSFFPAYGIVKRSRLLLIALLATFAANVIRMLVIVGAVGLLGQDALDIAHVVLGRVAFFVMAIIIYWFVITRPTLNNVAARLREAR